MELMGAFEFILTGCGVLAAYGVILGHLALNAIKKNSRLVKKADDGRRLEVCRVISRAGDGTWEENPGLVRRGSVDYHLALRTPGMAVIHRGGDIDEGIQ